MSNYIKALFMMLNAHKGQKDKGKHPYFLHPLRVSMATKNNRAKIVALLHDVLEDSNKYEIKDFNFLDEEQKKALLLLTHNDSDEYFEYIKRIKQNEISREVKLMDLKDNMNLKRLKKISNDDEKRLAKYKMARDILLSWMSNEKNK